jgi:thiosulfate/3-mercaptopyruvate sulfurtransferase
MDGMLITPRELYRHLHEPTWVIFDCRHDLVDHARGARVYAEAHIPSAHFAGVETDLSGPKNGTNGRHPLPEPAAFGAFLIRAGVSPATTIVAYDDSGGAYATRLWWLCRWLGHRHVLVLDGGLPAWFAEGYPMTQKASASALHAAPYPVRSGAMPVVKVEEVVANLSARRLLLLDARANRVAGHIPGARNRFHKTNLRPDGTFRPPDELHREFLALLEGRPATELVHYCGSGVTACVNLFAMELAALTGSQLYPGSWSEWSSDAHRPVAANTV